MLMPHAAVHRYNKVSVNPYVKSSRDLSKKKRVIKFLDDSKTISIRGYPSDNENEAKQDFPKIP